MNNRPRIPRAVLAGAVWLAFTTAASAQIVADFVGDKLVGVTPMFVQFTNLSTYPDGSNVEFLWDFGDGNFGVGKNPKHLYESEGVFTVSLAVHVGDQTNTRTRQEYIRTYTLRPDFEGSPRFALPPFQVPFINHTPPVGEFPITYHWTFGDGGISAAEHPTYTYTQQGAYDVALRATADGRSVTVTKPDYIQAATPNPDFNASPVLGVAPLNVQFANSTNTHGFPVTFLWEFGDGQISTEENPRHRYQDPGLYDVTLSVFSEHGALFTLTKPEFIDVVLNADFHGTPTAGVFPMTVQFKSLVPNQIGSATFAWDFGDGTTSQERDPLHTYMDEGVFDVSLTVNAGSVTEDIHKPEYIEVSKPGPFVRIFDCAVPADGFPEIEIDVVVYSEAGRNCALTQSNFSVTENGQPQPIQSVACKESTFSAVDFVFILDVSGSMGDNILKVRQEIKSFATNAVQAGISPRFGLITYETRPELKLALTPDPTRLVNALNNVTLWGGIEPAMDAVIYATDVMAFRSCAQRVLILITDEASNGDKHSLTDAVEAVIASHAVVIAVSPAPAFLYQGIDPRALADATSGSWMDILNADFSIILDDIVEFVLSTWKVRYTSTNPVPDGTLREIVVTVNDPVKKDDSESTSYVAPASTESAVVRNNFRTLDTNHDAKLSWTESGLDSFTFQAWDTNGDGYLTLEELLASSVGPVGVASTVWVDFNFTGWENGTSTSPFNTLDEGVAFVAPGGEVRVAPGTTPRTYSGAYAISKPARLVATNPAVRAGE